MPAGSLAPAADRRRSAPTQSGSQHWIGWCIRSPVITASWPPERIRTLTCPGVWPGVGSRRTSDGDHVVALDRVGKAGVDHRLHGVGEDSGARRRRRVAAQCVVARCGRTGSARSGRSAASGRRRGACSSRRGRVQVRAQHGVDRSGAKPAAVDRSRNGPCSWFHIGIARGLSLPTQVSTTMRLPSRLDDEGVDRRDRRPSRCAKCGRSQACHCTASLA